MFLLAGKGNSYLGMSTSSVEEWVVCRQGHEIYRHAVHLCDGLRKNSKNRTLNLLNLFASGNVLLVKCLLLIE